MIDYYHPNIDLTLLGCGFLEQLRGPMAITNTETNLSTTTRLIPPGRRAVVAADLAPPAVQQNLRRLMRRVGAFLVAGIKIEIVLDAAMDIIRKLRASLTNPANFKSIQELVHESLDRLLPENAHKLCSGKLGISVTKLWSLKNEFISNFESRDDLIDAIAAGCFIPIWSGVFRSPKYKGERCIDGAYSDNMPKFELSSDEKSLGVTQVSVSAFASEVQVSPKDTRSFMGTWRVLGTRYHCNWNNMIRTRHAMLPSAIPVYRPYIIQGHRDMKEYVLANNLIRCRHCYNSILNDTKMNEKGHCNQTSSGSNPKGCLSCLKLLEKVDSLKVPGELLKIMT